MVNIYSTYGHVIAFRERNERSTTSETNSQRLNTFSHAFQDVLFSFIINITVLLART